MPPSSRGTLHDALGEMNKTLACHAPRHCGLDGGKKMQETGWPALPTPWDGILSDAPGTFYPLGKEDRTHITPSCKNKKARPGNGLALVGASFSRSQRVKRR